MRTLFILMAATVLATPQALAWECTPTSSDPDVDTGTPDEARFYVDNDPCPHDGCMWSIWIYQESNGIDGLQRGDEAKDDTCGGMIAHDTIIF